MFAICSCVMQYGIGNKTRLYQKPNRSESKLPLESPDSPTRIAIQTPDMSQSNKEKSKVKHQKHKKREHKNRKSKTENIFEEDKIENVKLDEKNNESLKKEELIKEEKTENEQNANVEPIEINELNIFDMTEENPKDLKLDDSNAAIAQFPEDIEEIETHGANLREEMEIIMKKSPVINEKFNWDSFCNVMFVIFSLYIYIYIYRHIIQR